MEARVRVLYRLYRRILCEDYTAFYILSIWLPYELYMNSIWTLDELLLDST